MGVHNPLGMVKVAMSTFFCSYLKNYLWFNLFIRHSLVSIANIVRILLIPHIIYTLVLHHCHLKYCKITVSTYIKLFLKKKKKLFAIDAVL